MTLSMMTKNKNQNIYDLGKLPPQSVNAEEAVLGAILLQKDAILMVIDIISPETFYVSANKYIYKTMVDLFKEGKAIDIITVTESLIKSKKIEQVGGPYYINSLTEKVYTASNIEEHARIVYQKYVGRELIRISNDVQSKAYDSTYDILDIIESAQSKFFSLLTIRNSNSKELKEIQHIRLKEIIEHSKSGNSSIGIDTGFSKLNKITSGWQKSDLIIIAARPSMGKTTIALEMAIRPAKNNVPVDFYSLEMKDTQLYDKILSVESGIENSYLRSGKLNNLDWEKINEIKGSIDELPLFIDDTPALNVMEFRAKAMRNKTKNNTQLIIIDYLQLMKCPEAYKQGGREREVSEISSQLKSTAKELDVPIIALSQLNRSVEQRAGDKKPQLSDLRESGSIEQDADMVCFIHRPEYYGIIEDKSGDSTINLIEFIIAKHRNGKIGDIRLWRNKNWTEISEDEGVKTESEKSPF